MLVHPIVTDERVHLPCAYGYATTIRRAQGSSLDAGALYFDHCYPPERGYAYVGASRFRSGAGIFHFGPIRRSDWLPVGGGGDDEQIYRGVESESEDEQDEENEMLYSGSEGGLSEDDAVSDAGGIPLVDIDSDGDDCDLSFPFAG